mgnify:CR=1 FL=1
MVNWQKVIDKNRDALLRIVAALFDIAGLADTPESATLPRATRNYLLRILRPAESAARRLIVIAARGIAVEVKLLPASPLRGGRRVASKARQSRVGVRTADRGDVSPPPGSAAPSALRTVCFSDLPSRGRSKPKRSKSGIIYPPGYRAPADGETPTPATASFPLLDPLKRFDFTPRRRYATTVPRVRALADISLPVYMRTPEPPAWRPPAPDDEVEAGGVLRRLAALRRALGDIDGQARRLARWQARQDAGLIRAKRWSPMRPGWPPGRRKRPRYEVDDILADVHSLTLYALKAPDSG